MIDVKVENLGPIGLISLASRDGLNQIGNADDIEKIASEVDGLERNSEIRVIVIRGSEKAFSAGINATEFVKKVNSDVLEDMINAFTRIADAKKTVIAEVNGYAVGVGLELALACDMIFCSENSWFAVPDLSLGMIPAFGATQRLTKAVGKAKAMEMILTGRGMSADEADKIGIVSRVIPLGYLHPETIKVAERIASLPDLAISTAKELIKTAVGNTDLEEGLEIEKQVSKSALESEEYKINIENMLKK